MPNAPGGKYLVSHVCLGGALAALLALGAAWLADLLGHHLALLVGHVPAVGLRHPAAELHRPLPVAEHPVEDVLARHRLVLALVVWGSYG